jgi:hypothetical protein
MDLEGTLNWMHSDGISTQVICTEFRGSRFSVLSEPLYIFFLVLRGVKESEVIDMDDATTLGPMSKSSTNLGAVAKIRILLNVHEERRP